MAELIILGSGTGAPSLRRGSPGLALISGESRVVIDSGSGTLRRMLEVGITHRDVDLLLYTHTHPDHISDLVPILFACKYAGLPRRKDLFCAGGKGFKNYFEKLKGFYGSWIDPLSYRLTIEEMHRTPVAFRDLTISSEPMNHLPESTGYRIALRDEKSIVVSGDTDYCRNIVDLARGTDLLVLECSFPDGKKAEGHLTPSLAGRIGLESQARRLLLIHQYPVCDEFDIVKQCRTVYPGDVIRGEDLMRMEI
jgi:ribonuclease BN (tRNA processing enzyme)